MICVPDLALMILGDPGTLWHCISTYLGAIQRNFVPTLIRCFLWITRSWELPVRWPCRTWRSRCAKSCCDLEAISWRGVAIRSCALHQGQVPGASQALASIDAVPVLMASISEWSHTTVPIALVRPPTYDQRWPRQPPRLPTFGPVRSRCSSPCPEPRLHEVGKGAGPCSQSPCGWHEEDDVWLRAGHDRGEAAALRPV